MLNFKLAYIEFMSNRRQFDVDIDINSLKISLDGEYINMRKINFLVSISMRNRGRDRIKIDL